MAFNPNDHMMNLKGKEYLQVMWRLVWFREVRPLWSIEPEIIEMDDKHAVFRAVIRDEAGTVKCIGHGSESQRDFGDFIEKAETKAVGRALAMLGYGTQFTASELDEGERIVDSPVVRNGSRAAAQAVGRAKLAELDAKMAEQTAMPIGKVTEAQKAYIQQHASDADYLNIMQKYGPELERLSAKGAEKVIAQIDANNAAGAVS